MFFFFFLFFHSKSVCGLYNKILMLTLMHSEWTKQESFGHSVKKFRIFLVVHQSVSFHPSSLGPVYDRRSPSIFSYLATPLLPPPPPYHPTTTNAFLLNCFRNPVQMSDHNQSQSLVHSFTQFVNSYPAE